MKDVRQPVLYVKKLHLCLELSYYSFFLIEILILYVTWQVQVNKLFSLFSQETIYIQWIVTHLCCNTKRIACPTLSFSKVCRIPVTPSGYYLYTCRFLQVWILKLSIVLSWNLGLMLKCWAGIEASNRCWAFGRHWADVEEFDYFRSYRVGLCSYWGFW